MNRMGDNCALSEAGQTPFETGPISNVGHFGHGHFGLGRFGPDFSATDVSATENAKGGHFGQNHKFVGWGVCMHTCVMHFSGIN